MNIDKDIPEYAMIPAKSPEEMLVMIEEGKVEKELIRATKMRRLKKSVFLVEKDMLVPDIKADMMEIMYVQPEIVLDEKEVNVFKGKTLDVRGKLEGQILYEGESCQIQGKEASSLVGLCCEVPFVHTINPEWVGDCKAWIEADVTDCHITIINERKYKISAELSLEVYVFEPWEQEVFKAVNGEEMEYKKGKFLVEDCLGTVKDEIEIDEKLTTMDDAEVDEILNQKIEVLEVYRQVTREKIVINGFLNVEVLYRSENEEGQLKVKQVRDRVEFTQFIPLKNQQQYQSSRIFYDASALNVFVEKENGVVMLKLKGEVVCRVALLKTWEKEVVEDCYHLKEDFVCQYEEIFSEAVGDMVNGEIAVREIISVDSDKSEGLEISAACVKKLNVNGTLLDNHVVSEGTASVKIIFWREEKGKFFALDKEIPFKWKGPAVESSKGSDFKIKAKIGKLMVQQLNTHQIEINLSLVMEVEISRMHKSTCITKPSFKMKDSMDKSYGMAVYIVKPEDTLWDIGKRFKTTVKGICEINDIGEKDEKLSVGKKIMILK